MAPRTFVGRRCAGTLAALLSILCATTPASGQSTLREPRWLPWLGCWAPTAASTAIAPELVRVQRLCVFPDEGTGVQLATIADGEMTTRVSIPGAGVKEPVVRDGCAGWQQATWSRDRRRLYRRSELTCEGGAAYVSSGMFALLSASDWIEIEVGTLGGQPVPPRIARYREAPDSTEGVSVVIGSLAGRSMAIRSARIAAASVPTIDEVIEAARSVDAGVVEAWLVHRRPPFDVSARELSRMSDAGVNSNIIDVVVELSHPGVAGGRLGSGLYAVSRIVAPQPTVTTVPLPTPPQEEPIQESTEIAASGGGGVAWAPTYIYGDRYYYYYGFDRWGFHPYSYYGLYPFGGLGIIYRTGLFAYPRHIGYSYPYNRHYPYYPYYPYNTYPNYPRGYYPVSPPPAPPKSRGTAIGLPPRRTAPPAAPAPSEPAGPKGRAINGRGYTAGGSGTAAPTTSPAPEPTTSHSESWGRIPGPTRSGGVPSSGRSAPSVPRTATPRGSQPSGSASSGGQTARSSGGQTARSSGGQTVRNSGGQTARSTGSATPSTPKSGTQPAQQGSSGTTTGRTAKPKPPA